MKHYTDGYAANEMKPIFRFALRSDLEGDKRFLPTKANETDTGYDCRAAMPDRKPLIIKPFQYVKIPLGFRAIPPTGWWYKLAPRSSTFAKKHLHCLYGIVDQTFSQEPHLAAFYTPSLDLVPIEYGTLVHKQMPGTGAIIDNYYKLEDLTINFGDAIAQIIPVKREDMEIENISNEDYDKLYAELNGQNKRLGFGSSDGQK